MNRRKYLLSTLGLGTGLGIASQYNTQPSIATNINLNNENPNLPQDITNSKNPKLKLNFNKFEIKEKNYYSKEPAYTIEARTIYNDTKSKFELLEENIELTENGNLQNVVNRTYTVPLIIPQSLDVRDSFIIELELKFTTTNDNIGPFKKSERILFNVGEDWSLSNSTEPNESEWKSILEEMDGDGTKNSPYQITNDHELQSMNGELDAHYELVNNINVSGTHNWYNGKGFKPIGYDPTDEDRTENEFIGSIDGNGFEITSLTINRPNENYIGLIGYTENSKIENIGITDVDFVGDSYVGALIGENLGCNVTNTYSTGQLKGGSHTGGLVGWNNNSSEIKLSYSKCNVETTGRNAGGLAGRNENRSRIEKSYALGEVFCGSLYAGGLVGYSNSSDGVFNCYARGDTNGNSSNVGGLIGRNRNSDIENSYSVGWVNEGVEDDRRVGGLVGSSLRGSYPNTYWDVDTSGHDSSPEGRGRNTDEMQGESAETYLNFDFKNTWKIVENDYPILQWQEE